MWKKSDNAAAVLPAERSAVETYRDQSRHTHKSNGVSAPTMIGPSIIIDGAMSGEENIVMRGTMNGPIHLAQHQLTVAESGNANSNIAAHAIRVDGNVEGELDAQQVLITASGVVKGKLTMSNITLEDGGKVQGVIDTSGSTSK